LPLSPESCFQVADGKPAQRAVVSCSFDGAFLAAVWPVARRYAVYRRGASAWEEVCLGAGRSLAWHHNSHRFAVVADDESAAAAISAVAAAAAAAAASTGKKKGGKEAVKEAAAAAAALSRLPARVEVGRVGSGPDSLLGGSGRVGSGRIQTAFCCVFCSNTVKTSLDHGRYPPAQPSCVSIFCVPSRIRLKGAVTHPTVHDRVCTLLVPDQGRDGERPLGLRRPRRSPGCERGRGSPLERGLGPLAGRYLGQGGQGRVSGEWVEFKGE